MFLNILFSWLKCFFIHFTKDFRVWEKDKRDNVHSCLLPPHKIKEAEFYSINGKSCLWTEWQNHRMVGVERDLYGSSGPTLLPKQGHLQQAAQDLVQAGLE